MAILRWLIIGGLSVAIISALFLCLFLIRLVIHQQKLAKLPQKSPKAAKKKQRWRKLKKDWRQQRNQTLKWVIISSLIFVVSTTGTTYANYYQSIHLTSEDSRLVVRGYFLLRDFQDQIEKAATQTEEQVSIEKEIRYLSTNLASYGTYAASSLNTVEGQTALNRYYLSLGEIGMNASRQIGEFYPNPDLLEYYSEDIERTQGLEQKVIEYYHVNEASLISKGQGDEKN
ncbi:hypothetical protein ACYSNU_02955 [Enterococcus sp. LJL120]